MTDTGEPKPIGEGVERILASLGAPPPKVTTGVADRWVDIVGTELATVTAPGSLRDGTLVVTTTEPAVADHLKWSEQTVIDRANEVLETTAVTALRVRVMTE